MVNWVLQPRLSPANENLKKESKTTNETILCRDDFTRHLYAVIFRRLPGLISNFYVGPIDSAQAGYRGSKTPSRQPHTYIRESGETLPLQGGISHAAGTPVVTKPSTAITTPAASTAKLVIIRANDPHPPPQPTST